MKSELVVEPSIVGEDYFIYFFSSFKDDVSQFQSFRVNFYKFHSPFSTRLAQLG
jgi:hypothetical protein